MQHWVFVWDYIEWDDDAVVVYAISPTIRYVDPRERFECSEHQTLIVSLTIGKFYGTAAFFNQYLQGVFIPNGSEDLWLSW